MDKAQYDKVQTKAQDTNNDLEPLIRDGKQDQDFQSQTSAEEQKKNDYENMCKTNQAKARFKDFDENEESTQMESITYIEPSYLKRYTIVPILGICTAFIFLVCLYNSLPLRKKWLYLESTRQRATHLYIVGKPGNINIVPLRDQSVDVSPFLNEQQRELLQYQPYFTFIYRFIQFEFIYEKERFEAITFDICKKYNKIHEEHSYGIRTDAQVFQHRMRYGRCELHIPEKSILQLLIHEVLNPFYVFQIFSMILWFSDNYELYASCILVVSLASAFQSIYEIRRNTGQIKKMAQYSCWIKVKRDGDFQEIDSSLLVPGDLVEVPENCTLPCDMILLTGSCIVNEAMLTGESIPVIKNSLPVTEHIYTEKDGDKHTLFGGTKIIQTRGVQGDKVKAIISRTGFVTTKGNLVRDILYPRNIKFKFYNDAMTFVGVMACVAILGFLCTLPFQVGEVEPVELVDRSLDLITVTVPPALPAAMTCGIVFSISRLRKQSIYCISPPRVNLAGRVTMMVFDKTGTLTEDSLAVKGFRASQTTENKNMGSQLQFGQFIENCSDYQSKDWWNRENAQEIMNRSETLFLESLASCHSITYVKGELIGDPLDVKMFEATGWVLDEDSLSQSTINDEVVLGYMHPKGAYVSQKKQNDTLDQKDSLESQLLENKIVKGAQNNYRIALVKRFDFSSKLQRASAIVKNSLDNQYRAFVKGSPEKISELCRPESIPLNFQEVMDIYTQKGFRVLAMATKKLDNFNYLKLQKSQREDVECDLQFLGLLIMENKLKPITSAVIENLNACKVRTIMATGDNVLTAISVARQCNVLDSQIEVFLGDLGSDEQGNINVQWKSTKPLMPESFVRPQAKIKQSLRQSNDNLLQSPKASSMRNGLNNINLSDMASSNIDNLNTFVHGDIPWNYLDENIAVAITGKAFNFLASHPEHNYTLQRVLFKSQVYARMSPDDKALLVENLQDTMQTQIGMCGDGANDCGALKAADVGLSLSEAEASIAAPFTSKVQDISSVVTLLREGRAALTTSFQSFKFIELYSIIQFVTVTMLYLIDGNLTDTQFLYIDLIALVPLSIFQAWTGSYHKLTKDLPPNSLFYAPVLFSVISSSIIQFCFQIYMFMNVQNTSFFLPASETQQPKNTIGYQNSVVFLVSNFQYLFTCLAFSVSKPFRKPIYTNMPFFITSIIVIIVDVYLVLYPDQWTMKVWGVMDMPQNYRFFILFIMVINSVITILWEKIPVKIFGQSYDKRKLKQKQQKLLDRIEEANNLQNDGPFLKANNGNKVENNHRSQNKNR